MQRFSHLRVVDGSVDIGGAKAIALWWLAAAATEEFLQGSPMAPAFVSLFQAHLQPGSSWFRWAGDLAESAEMRRALSGLYGRIVARALLTHRLGFTDFVSLNRYETTYGGLQVSRNTKIVKGDRIYVEGDIPDWIALDPRTRRAVLCEAKGALTGSEAQFKRGTPSCVADGKKQFGRVRVTRGTSLVATRNWVAANFWATEKRKRTPVSLLFDPPSQGEDIPDDRWSDIQAGATMAWARSILSAIGIAQEPDTASVTGGQFAVTIKAKPSRKLEQRTVDPGQKSGNLDSANILLPDHEWSSEAFEGSFYSALITSTGLTFIRSPAELEAARARIDEERKGGRTALLTGLSTSAITRSKNRSGTLWISLPGMVRSDGFALFDACQVEIGHTPPPVDIPKSRPDANPKPIE